VGVAVDGAAELSKLFSAALRTVEGSEAQSILDAGADRIKKRAQAELGIYQEAVGPFAAWAPLAAATLAHKSGDTPLYEEGDLEKAIDVLPSGEPYTAYVGITDPDMQVIGAALEFGAPAHNLPPRPFMGPALYLEEDQIRQEIGDLVITGFGIKGGYTK
jgi:hypothetical protein